MSGKYNHNWTRDFKILEKNQNFTVATHTEGPCEKIIPHLQQVCQNITTSNEPRHEISNNVVCATCKSSIEPMVCIGSTEDLQVAHTTV